MTFSESVETCFAKYVTWQGRASRSEYWWFVPFVFLAYIVGVVIDNVLGTAFTIPDPMTGEETSAGYGWVTVLIALGLFLPNLSVVVRRLHDKGRSGWWYWIALIPLIGSLILLYWFVTRGTEWPNDYGPDPLGADLDRTFG